MSITKLKRGETYFYVDGWTDDRENPGTMRPTRVSVIEAVTGGAKAPKVRHAGSKRHFQIFFGGQYSDNAVWAEREEAEAATVFNEKLHRFLTEETA